MSMAQNHRGGAIAAMLLVVAACATTPQRVSKPPPAPSAPALDASYDWHGLLLLPFGSVLKDAPFALHEVLMFRDAAHAAQSDDAECYAFEQTAPRFLARTPSEYLLCFRHDRLARVEATVILPQEEAPRIFDDACALWQRSAGAGAGLPGAGPPGAEPTETIPAAAAGAGACEGRDGTVIYSGRLEENVDPAARALTIRLDALTQP